MAVYRHYYKYERFWKMHESISSFVFLSSNIPSFLDIPPVYMKRTYTYILHPRNILEREQFFLPM